MERYAGYKDSGVEWIGEIPYGWTTRRVTSLLDRSSFGLKVGPFGSAIKDKVIDEGPYKMYGQANLIRRDFSYGNKYVSQSTYHSLEAYYVAPEDILVSVMGTIGKCSVVPQGIQPGIMDSHLIKLRLSAECIPRYFEYAYECDCTYEQLICMSKGSIMNGLNSEMVKNAQIALPSLNEQQAIADYLDAKTAEVDALVAGCERELELLREYRRAVISDAVTKGLDPDAPMKDSSVEWIGEIPETWSIAKVKSCCDILPGYAFKSELFMQESSSVKLLRGINLGVNVIRWDEVVSYPSGEIEELGTYRLLAGDVVIGLDRPWIKEGLRIAIVQDEGFEQYLVQRVARLRGSSELDVRYVKYALESGLLEYELDSLTTGVSVPHISTEQIGSTRIALPDIATQHEIVVRLDTKTAEIDSLVEAKQQMVDKLREYRKSLISEAVTGKFKVPGVK